MLVVNMVEALVLHESFGHYSFGGGGHTVVGKRATASAKESTAADGVGKKARAIAEAIGAIAANRRAAANSSNNSGIKHV